MTQFNIIIFAKIYSKMFFRRRFKFLILLVLSIFLIFVYNLSVQDSTSIIDFADSYTEPSFLADNSFCDKWIVLTTINPPTSHVKYLRDSALGWCVVIVADQKTPASWQYKDVHFLSIEKQKEEEQ